MKHFISQCKWTLNHSFSDRLGRVPDKVPPRDAVGDGHEEEPEPGPHEDQDVAVVEEKSFVLLEVGDEGVFRGVGHVVPDEYGEEYGEEGGNKVSSTHLSTTACFSYTGT